MFASKVMECWKRIKNFYNYSISDLGKVRNTKYKRLLKIKTDNKGYQSVVLYKNNKRYYFLLHRLLADAFIGKCSDGYQVNHKDGNPSNNNIDNLEYLTPSQNTKHAYDIGLATGMMGESNPRAKLTVLDVRKIKQRLQQGVSVSVLAKEYNVTWMAIKFIKIGKNWKEAAVM